jgi:MFS family permease
MTAGDEFRAGWRVLLAGFAGTMFGISALPFYTLGLFVKPLGEAFGWSRAAVQWGFTAQMLGTILVIWAYGLMTDRYGARRVALLSQVGLGIALLGVAAVQSLPHWYVAWFLVAVLGAGTSPVTWTRGVNGWFDAGRGTALGLTLTGTGLTAVLAPPLVTAVVAAEGWRAGYVALGLGVLAIALPLTWLLFRDRPVPASAPLAGLGRRAAFRSRRFWTMFVVFALVTFAVSGVIPTVVPMLTDRGVSAGDAALYASLAGLAVIAGRIVAGMLLDRFWAPGVAAVFLLLPAAACLLLASDAIGSPLAVGLAVVLVGLAAGAEFDLIAFMASRYFGMAHYGLIYSQLLVGAMLGGAFGPPLFGRVFDQTGSYQPALWLAAAIFVAAPLALLTLGRYPARDGLAAPA